MRWKTSPVFWCLALVVGCTPGDRNALTNRMQAAINPEAACAKRVGKDLKEVEALFKGMGPSTPPNEGLEQIRSMAKYLRAMDVAACSQKVRFLHSEFVGVFDRVLQILQQVIDNRATAPLYESEFQSLSKRGSTLADQLEEAVTEESK
jgi:hypothetical protein